jgi:hypothetical protein
MLMVPRLAHFIQKGFPVDPLPATDARAPFRFTTPLENGADADGRVAPRGNRLRHFWRLSKIYLSKRTVCALAGPCFQRVCV